MTARPLTPSQRIMLRCFAHRGADDGVPLMGSNDWRTARALEARELGWVEKNPVPRLAIAGHFFANDAGLAAIGEAVS
jgi:hypothetical protein